MDFNALERAWQKQVVTGGDEPAELVMGRMESEVAIAQRRIRGGMILAAFVLFLGWAVTIVAHFTLIKPLTPVALIAQMVSSVLLILFLVRAARSTQAVRNEMEMMGGTLRESVGATLRVLELQIQNARIAGYVIPAVAAIAGGLFLVKYLAKDIPGIGAAMGSVFLAIFGAVIGAGIWHRYRTYLAPRREELREIQRALGSGNE
jgi:hypothetical protein